MLSFGSLLLKAFYSVPSIEMRCERPQARLHHLKRRLRARPCRHSRLRPLPSDGARPRLHHHPLLRRSTYRRVRCRWCESRLMKRARSSREQSWKVPPTSPSMTSSGRSRTLACAVLETKKCCKEGFKLSSTALLGQQSPILNRWQRVPLLKR